MLKHPTIEKLNNMGLTGMIRALELQSQLQDVHTLSLRGGNDSRKNGPFSSLKATSSPSTSSFQDYLLGVKQKAAYRGPACR